MKSLHLNGISLRIENFNNHFLLLKYKGYDSLIVIGAAIHNARLEFIDEVISSENEIYIKLNKAFTNLHFNALQKIEISSKSNKRKIKIPIHFTEHEDWRQIENHTGLTRDTYITELKNASIELSMFGFLPGFVYLKGIPVKLHIPRKDNPSTQIKRNSLAIGGHYVGIYSIPSPGGWHVVGEVILPIFDLEKQPPVFIESNDEITLIDIRNDEVSNIQNSYKNIAAYNGIF